MARIRSSPRRKPAAAAVSAPVIDFPHLWRQLRAAGWASKRPTGLENEWTYTSPDGATVLRGERAVVTHAVASGLLNISDEESDAEVVDNGDGDENVRASQIDTTVELTQGTVDALFDSARGDLAPAPEAGVELSQAAVTRAFGLSQSDLAVDESQREAATCLTLLSEVSGADSEEEKEEEPAAPPRQVLRRRVVKTDVNVVPEDEHCSDYESFDSDDGDGVEEDADSDPELQERDDRDDYISEEDAVEMDMAFVQSLQLGTDEMSVRARKVQEEALRSMQWTTPSSTFEVGVNAYEGLGHEIGQPVQELRGVCHSPLLTFFYFMPKSLWVQINQETNRYGLQQVQRRAEAIQARQSDRRRETVKQIKRRLKAKPSYETHEIMHVLGLLVARMLCPQQRLFKAHWAMTEDGAIPAGTFGKYMSRTRCVDIMRDLHFVDNESPRSRDKLWKLRPVIAKLQNRFLTGWTLPAVFSFDEGVLPSTSKRNTTRMFMPDKPHRYGSKMFMTCCSKTAYCYRFEMYAGLRNTGERGDTSFDHKTGAAAVIRNLSVVLEAGRRHAWHAVVIDRFYSSILLAIELLGMSVYVIGTIMLNRLGYDANVKETRKTRPASIPRGTFTFSRSVAVPKLIAFHWWDRKPVHYLCTGSAMTEATIARNIKQVGRIVVPSPAATFSLQTSTKFKKYYKSLFLGFVDLAMVNSYLSHKETAKLSGKSVMKRSEWFTVLQNQLLQLKAEDFVGVVATPPTQGKRKRVPLALSHEPQQIDDWVVVSGVQKRRQRSCKVCALLRTEKKKSFATTYYCERCSIDDAKCWLCNKIRREYKGVNKTCFDIWHDDFRCGENIPPTLGKRVVLRRPGNVGKRKKTRRELQLNGNEDSGVEEDQEHHSSEDEWQLPPSAQVD